MDKKITLEIFGRRLKKLREQHNLSTKVLGEIVGVSDATISRYENGKRDPDLMAAYNIAEYFGVTVEYLCGENSSIEIDNLIEIYSKLSDESKQDAIKYITYLNEKGR
ncbi:MAG: helix-turn-helix domain-containing protein [Endomicrobiaceae bacterium]|nr:helix-turn-helix domain-containing protein [Endomicrobiaceae bacterium]